MGNKLCAPLWKKHHGGEDSPWSIKKDAHLLRLWAEVYQVTSTPEGPLWNKIVEDTVPVNITLLQDGQPTVFQVSAYNRQVERIFDVQIKQPGTIFDQSSECFVHWKSDNGKEWGLNFASVADVRKFKDCCSHVVPQRFRRKSPSSSSLKLSPPKRWRSKRGKSAPNSPGSRPRRSMSSPEDVTSPDEYDPDYEEYGAPVAKSHSLAQSVATMPRMRTRQVQDARSVFDNEPRSISSPASQASVYDSLNVTQPRGNKYANTPGGSGSLRGITNSKNRPPPPFQRMNSLNENVGQGQGVSAEDDGGFGAYSQRKRGGSKRGNDSLPRTPGTESYSSGGSRNVENLTLNLDRHSQRESSVPKSSSSEDWPAPPDPIAPQTPQTPVVNADFDADSLKRMLRKFPDNNQDQGYHGDENSSDRGRERRRSSSSNNGNNHYVHRAQSLNTYDRNGQIIYSPDGSSGYHTPRSPTYQQGTYITEKEVQNSTGSHSGHKSDRLLMEYELALRSACAKESYPDSGIGGTVSETAGSIRSGGSRGSSKSGSKSSTLPPGLGLGMMKSSTAGSSSGSTGSSSRRHKGSSQTNSDYSTEVRQFMVGSEASDDESDSDNSIDTMPPESQASFARQSGATRKAGWLTVKNWLIHKKRKVELAPKRNWKRYWVSLKGTTLFFFTCDDQSTGTVTEDSVPRHMLVIEGGIAQAVPEHPKRENIFALSTAFGDAYLFEAPSQIEQENWICALHSACASLFARQHGKDNTLKLLRNEIQKLENSIDIDIKMKKMADLQITVVTDSKSKNAISKQIQQWEENLEKLYIEQYRLRCYMASLQGSELPNPKSLLMNVSKSTKASLGRLGVFTVTSFHALVCARTPLTMTSLYNKSNKKKGLLSTFKADAGQKIRSKTPTRTFIPASSTPLYRAVDIDEDAVVDFNKPGNEVLTPEQITDTMNFGDNMARILLPNQQTLMLPIQDKMTVQDVLETACNKRQLNPNDHFVSLKVPNTGSSNQDYVPDKMSFMEKQIYERIEIHAKIIFQLELLRTEHDLEFGFCVEAELADDSERDDELCVFVSDVIRGGLAQRRGLIVGDEILVVNSKVVSELDMVFVESVIQDARSLCLTIRSCRTERPANSRNLEHVDLHIDNMMCPPPPSQSRISDKVIDDLIVPAPNWIQQTEVPEVHMLPPPRLMHGLSTEQIHQLLQKSEQVTQFCRQSNERDFVEGPPLSLALSLKDQDPLLQKPLSEAQKLRKVIMELIDTERAYVKDLNCLIERYLEPLKEETFLTNEEIEALFGNIQEIVQFQKLFLQSLEEAVNLEPDFMTLSDPKHFRRILFSLGGSFLYYANHFKLYSSFCASHSKAQKVLKPEDNSPLREFLRARNPKQQHSATLESYLIKPIQRILKYPLLLNQLRSLTERETDEHYHLSEALRGMEAVAEHINEMQKLYEEYCTVFDDLVKEYKEFHGLETTIDLNVGDLYMYGAVEWLNYTNDIGKIKKGMELATTIFVFKTGVVILAKERIKQKKKGRPVSMRGSMIENPEIIRFQTVIPVSEVQVRSNANNDARTQLYWELLRIKSEKEGRPEKSYQMANSTLEAKNDFMRTIRQVIRENVRKQALPPNKQQPPRGRSYIPYGGKRLQNLSSNPRSISKKRGNRIRAQIERHSMELDERFNVMDQNDDFRTRSMTLSDVNNGDEDSVSGGYPSSAHSQASIDSRSSTGSAKLLQSSQNPMNYSPASSMTLELGSPVWKPRDEWDDETKTPVPFDEDDDSQTLIITSPYADYPSVYSDQGNAVLLSPPNTYMDGDTEC